LQDVQSSIGHCEATACFETYELDVIYNLFPHSFYCTMLSVAQTRLSQDMSIRPSVRHAPVDPIV